MPSTRILRFASFLALSSGAWAQTTHHYAVFLEDPPVAEQFHSKEHLVSTAALTYRRQIQGKQEKLRAVLATRRVTITGAADTILNAVFVTATTDRAAELQ